MVTILRNRRIVAAVMLLMLTLAFGMANTTNAYAKNEEATTASSEKVKSGDKDLGDVNVNMGKDGKLTNSLDNSDSSSSFNTIFQKTKVYILAFSGLATLLFIGMGIKQAIVIANSSGNPSARSQALSGLLWILIAVAIAGSITTVVAIAWNFGK